MKLWLDDERPAPEGWIWSKNAYDTIDMLDTEVITELSLDHDLGEDPEVGDGYKVLNWIEEQVFARDFKPPVIDIHTQNVSARKRMEQAVLSIRKHSHT